MLRREVITSLLALAASPAISANQSVPNAQAVQEFDPAMVLERARMLAAQPYRSRTAVPKEWTSLTYDQYRAIWFNERHALWADRSDTSARVDMFAPGLYFPHPIEIYEVDSGHVRNVPFDFSAFDKTDQFPDLPIDETLGYSGLRLRAETQREKVFQEFTVFQGASYFRAIGPDQIYGLSARGLAIDTAEPRGEEFPDFVAFWLERPGTDADFTRIHALLDSPSCTGAYTIDITHKSVTKMRIRATLFARKDITHIGIAPLTSMFQFDQTNRDAFFDFRPAVHDSDGLLMHNGAGEIIWRPLANPKTLQISSFQDDGPKGFGLMQRPRKFSDFADLEALYHRRPSAWVTPNDDWGAGAVTLVEIPTDKEIYDNIVAYWRPQNELKQGQSLKLDYDLDWGVGPPEGGLARVVNTSAGAGFSSGIVVTIDFAPHSNMPSDLTEVEKLLQSSAGRISSGVLQRNPETGGARLAFTFHPDGAELIEFRAQLRLSSEPLSEVWLYRWTV